jgi:protein-S-isoprenylcysteine O-methyltransferase Ste14
MVADPQRSLAARAHEAAFSIVFWLWVWMIIEYAWPPPPAWLPHWLTVQLIDSQVAQWIGAVLVVFAVVVYPVALAAMGDSWRMGIERQSSNTTATFITHGPFRFSRNPIYAVVDLLFAGTFLIHGQSVFLILTVAFALLLHLQILREERFLATRYGEPYEAYRQRVGRYGPRLTSDSIHG